MPEPVVPPRRLRISLQAKLLAVILLPLSIVVTAAGRDQPQSSQPPITAPKNVEFAGSDGNGCDRAVVIRGSKGSRDIVTG